MTLDWQTSRQDNLTPASQCTMQVVKVWLWRQQGTATAAQLTWQIWWCISTKTARHNLAQRRPITQLVTPCPTILWLSSFSNSKLTAKECTSKSNRPLAQIRRHRRKSKINQPWWCRMISAQWLRKCYNSGAREVMLYPASSKSINRCPISSSSSSLTIKRRPTRFLTIFSATQRRYTLGTIWLIAKAVRALPKVQPRHTLSIRMSLQEVATRMPLTLWSSVSATSSLIRISTIPDTQAPRIKIF